MVCGIVEAAGGYQLSGLDRQVGYVAEADDPVVDVAAYGVRAQADL